MRLPPECPTKSGRIFYRAAMVSALTVGALQMYHLRGGVLTDYGADVFGTAWIYAMTRLGWTFAQRGRTLLPGLTALVVFVLCAASELGQRLGWVPGHYDPLDVVAFAVTVVACLALERTVGPFAAAPSIPVAPSN